MEEKLFCYSAKFVILNGSSETSSSNLSLLVSIKFQYLPSTSSFHIECTPFKSPDSCINLLYNSKYCQDSSTTKSTLIDTFQQTVDCDSASSTDNHDINNTDLLLQNQDGKYSGDRKSYQFVLTQNEWLSLYESKRAVTLHRELTNVFNKNLLTFFHFAS